jgi:dTDP-4-dehydrorhamnose reductase
MKKTILITGSNGLLGQKLVYGLLQRNASGASWNIIATARGANRLKVQEGYSYVEMNIGDENAVRKILTQHKPDVVINTAAMTNVDQCESAREEATLLNATSVRFMTETLSALQQSDPDYKVHFIHLSTDFIFDGENGPYTETAQPNPLSHYAATKLDGEKYTMASGLKWSILRTIIVYGIADDMSRSNLVLWAKGALEKGQKINVVNDQFRSPTLAEDLAEGCILCAEKSAEGIFNISGEKTYSILDLVYKVADYWKLDQSLINPVSSATINQPAKRPPRTGFIIDKAKSVLGYRPHSFEEGLAVLDAQLKERN